MLSMLVDWSEFHIAKFDNSPLKNPGVLELVIVEPIERLELLSGEVPFSVFIVKFIEFPST